MPLPDRTIPGILAKSLLRREREDGLVVSCRPPDRLCPAPWAGANDPFTMSKLVVHIGAETGYKPSHGVAVARNGVVSGPAAFFRKLDVPLRFAAARSRFQSVR